MATRGVKLSKRKVGRMWKLFQEGWSVRSIAQKCDISVTTITKYRRRQGWDQRRAEIVQRAEQKADERQVSILSESMEVVRIAKQKLMDQIKKLKSGEELSKSPVADLDRLIRLEEFLHGRPDSRPEIDYSGYSEEELTVELQATVEELATIPGCRQLLQKLLN